MIGIVGCSGKMGKEIIKAAQKENVKLSGGYYRGDMRDLGEIGDIGKTLGIFTTQDIDDLFKKSDVIIEFSTPKISSLCYQTAQKYQKPIVSGTTGLTEAEHKIMKTAAKQVPIVYSANMSIAVSLMKKLIMISALKIGHDFDIDIAESHHKEKKDAPSGTALMLANAITETLNTKTNIMYQPRHPRQRNDIVVHSTRCGSVSGEHTVQFAGETEILQITHKAINRQAFARGAIIAAKWIARQKPGLYNMDDVIG